MENKALYMDIIWDLKSAWTIFMSCHVYAHNYLPCQFFSFHLLSWHFTFRFWNSTSILLLLYACNIIIRSASCLFPKATIDKMFAFFGFNGSTPVKHLRLIYHCLLWQTWLTLVLMGHLTGPQTLWAKPSLAENTLSRYLAAADAESFE